MKKINFGRNKKVANKTVENTADVTPPKSAGSKFKPTFGKKNKSDVGASNSPIPTKADDGFLLKQPKKNSANLLILIIGILILLALAVLYYTKFANPTADVEPIEDTSAQIADTPAPEATAPEPTPPAVEQNTAKPTTIGDINLENIPNPEEIVSAPLPTSDALAKEEIQRLSDQAQRLQEQEALLAEQVAMMEELNSKKAEQIDLLEAQIAELEASQ